MEYVVGGSTARVEEIPEEPKKIEMKSPTSPATEEEFYGEDDLEAGQEEYWNSFGVDSPDVEEAIELSEAEAR